ncbi:MAG: hypothetical protein ACTS4T_00670 [Candidatus Hodgkinia cicadicola]
MFTNIAQTSTSAVLSSPLRPKHLGRYPSISSNVRAPSFHWTFRRVTFR